MRAGRCCSLGMSGRSRWAGAALLASVALVMLPSVARAQDETSGDTQPPTPGQTELPEVKVEAPKEETPKPPPKPAAAQKPARPEEPVAPRRVVAPKPPLTPKPAAVPVPVAEPAEAPARVARPAAAPVPVAQPVAAPAPPAPEPIAETSDLVDVSPVAGSGIDRNKIPANVPQPLGPQDFEHSKAPDLLQALTRSLPFTSLENQSGNQFQQDFNYRGFVACRAPARPQSRGS